MENNKDYWDKVFNNPKFSPHPEVMHFSSYYPRLNKKKEKENIDEKVQIKEEKVQLKEDIVIKEETEEKIEEIKAENKGLMPINSVVYEISDAEKQKKKLFRRK